MRRTIVYSLLALSFLIFNLFTVDSVSADMPLPSDKQSWSYDPVESPIFRDDPSGAEPVGLGPAASGGGMLSLHIGLSRLSAPGDMYGAFKSSFDPNVVNVPNPDG